MNASSKWLAVAAFAMAILGTGAMRRFALRKNMLDVPNSRSSHAVPTPRCKRQDCGNALPPGYRAQSHSADPDPAHADVADWQTTPPSRCPGRAVCASLWRRSQSPGARDTHATSR